MYTDPRTSSRGRSTRSLHALWQPLCGMDSSSSHPLRPYYKPREEVSFVATAPPSGGGGGGAGGGAAVPLGSGARANRYMPAEADAALAVASENTTPGNFLRGLFLSGALQFSSTCLAMPFEVGKLLLQVQWVPRQDVWARMHVPLPGSRRGSTASREHDVMDEDPWARARNSWDEDDGEPEEAGADEYFREEGREEAPKAHPRRVDSGGYMVPDGVHDDEARPEFVMPVVVRGGVWEMMKAVARGKEGWLGLWKGAVTTFLLDVVSSTLQPLLTSVFSIFAPTVLSPVPISFSPRPIMTLMLLLASHVATGVAVSPLDLVRTRLIAQSTLPAHRKYHGPIDALRKILAEEGGWRTLYLAPTLLIPTLLDNVLRPFLSLVAPLLIENTLRLDPASGPISYALAELLLSTLALGVTLPIETVRRRLQLQPPTPVRPARLGGLPTGAPRTASRGLRTCVETRPVAYTGVTEALYRIITEETTVVPRKGDDEDAEDAGTLAASGYSSLGGLRSLYRGFGMGFSANLLVFVLTLVTGEREGASGWTEL